MIDARGYIYDWNGNLQYILTADGRLVLDGDKYRFEYFMNDHLGNTRSTYAQAVPGLAQVAEFNHYYPFGMVIEDLSYQSGADLPNNHLYNGKELQKDYGLEWYDYGARMYDAALGRWHTIDPMVENNHFESTPYAYVYNNPLAFADPFGLDSVFVLDKGTRPNDNGKAGETYTADVYVVQNGEINGPYKGSSYPNSFSNSDNSTNANTANEGKHAYNNANGHDGGKEQGLNLVDANGERNTPGTDPDGNALTMTLVNVHEGASDNGNYNSRGSQGCVTIKPDDAANFFGNFNWSGTIGNTGNSTGTLFIQRGDNTDATRTLFQGQQDWQQNPMQRIEPIPSTRVTVR